MQLSKQQIISTTFEEKKVKAKEIVKDGIDVANVIFRNDYVLPYLDYLKKKFTAEEIERMKPDTSKEQKVMNARYHRALQAFEKGLQEALVGYKASKKLSGTQADEDFTYCVEDVVKEFDIAIDDAVGEFHLDVEFMQLEVKTILEEYEAANFVHLLSMDPNIEGAFRELLPK